MKNKQKTYLNFLKLHLKLIDELRKMGREDLIQIKIKYAKSAIDEFTKIN